MTPLERESLRGHLSALAGAPVYSTPYRYPATPPAGGDPDPYAWWQPEPSSIYLRERLANTLRRGTPERRAANDALLARAVWTLAHEAGHAHRGYEESAANVYANRNFRRYARGVGVSSRRLRRLVELTGLRGRNPFPRIPLTVSGIFGPSEPRPVPPPPP